MYEEEENGDCARNSKEQSSPGELGARLCGMGRDRNSISWIPVGPAVGRHLEPSVTQLEESFPRAGAGLVNNEYNSNSDITSSTVKC